MPSPGEDDAVVGGPEELMIGFGSVKDAAGAAVGDPDLMALARGHVGNADGPGNPGAAGFEGDAGGVRGNANEGDLAAVRRPDGVDVDFRGGVEVGEHLRGEREDADEGVIAAIAGPGEVLAVRGPGERAWPAAAMKELRGFGGRIAQIERPDLIVEDVGDSRSVGRDDRIAAGSEHARAGAVGIDDPDILLHALGQQSWIRRRTLRKFKVAPADVDDVLRVRGPGDLADLDAVVGNVMGHATQGVAGTRRLGHPDIAVTVLIVDPEKGAPDRCGLEIGGEGRAHDLLQRERLGGGGIPEDEAEEESEEADSQTSDQR